MRGRAPARRAAALLFVGMLLGGGATAGTIAVAPTRVDLPDAASLGAVDVQNRGTNPRRFQVDVVRWPRAAPTTPAPEAPPPLVAVPLSVVIPPGGQQIVRVGCVQACADVTGSFRLRLREVDEREAIAGEVPVLLNLTLPFFVGPAPRDGELAWSVKPSPEGWTIAVQNRGVRGDQLTALEAFDAHGVALGMDAALPRYVLERETLTLTARGAASPVRLRARWGSRWQDVALP